MSKGYKIGDACKELDVQPYVLRYWETEFPFLRPEKGSSGPRVYSDDEIGLIRRIKELLYDEGYTIAGAKKKLEAELESGKTPSARSSAKKGADAARSSESASDEETTKEPAEQAQRRLGEDEDEPSEAPPDAAEPGEESPDRAGATSLDSPSNERIETIARGLRALRDEARELLELLERGASSASEE